VCLGTIPETEKAKDTGMLFHRTSNRLQEGGRLNGEKNVPKKRENGQHDEECTGGGSARWRPETGGFVTHLML